MEYYINQKFKFPIKKDKQHRSEPPSTQFFIKDKMQASTSTTLSQSDIVKNLKLDEEKDTMKYLTESVEYFKYIMI